eukprot:s172_g19.t1
MPRDSRSRSGRRFRRDPSRRHGGRSDRHRRSRSPRRHDQRRSELRGSAPLSSKPVDLPSHWQSTNSHYDTTISYGLSFPRQIESTQWSRKVGLVGQELSSVRVIDVIPNGIANYGMRLLANGRYTTFELFRTRLDALVASTLMKEIYQRKDTFDLNKLVSHFASEDADLNEWDQKCAAVQKLSIHILDHLQTLMPVDQQTDLLKQMEALRAENARLKGEQVDPPPAELDNPPSESGPLAKRGSLPAMFGKAPPPSKAEGLSLSQLAEMKATPAPRSSEPAPPAPPLSSYRRPSDKPPYYGTNPPGDHTKTKITQWIKRFISKELHSEVETLTAKIKEEYQNLTAGERPSLDPILTDWGLTSTLLSKANMDAQFRLLAAVQFVKN